MTGTKEDWNKGEAMGGLIWIIVIVVVISEIKKFQRKNGQRVKPNVPRQQQYMRPDQTKVGQQNVRPNQMPRQQQNVRPNQMPRQQQGMCPNQMAGAHELVNAIDIDSASELMHEVEDLMIMGYQANLPFERDFIAEGVAMLNGYELDMGA